MAKYINKDALVAEIEKLKYVIMPYPTMAEKVAYRDGIEDTIKIVIKSLEVKEVDLDAEIMKYQREIYDRDTTVRDIAKYFFELGLKAQKGE